MDKIIQGDCIDVLKSLPDGIVNTCITSPPYFGLRDYGVEGQIGLEETPEAYVQRLVEVFREVRRVLRDDGTLWLNLGDSYAGSGMGSANYPDTDYTINSKQSTSKGSMSVGGRGGKTYGLKPKDLIGIPWRVAFALQADGWYLRQDIIWHKPNPMPESVTDRCTKSHEYIFLLSKSKSYYYDHEAIKEPITESSKQRVLYPRYGENSKGNSGNYAVVNNNYNLDDTTRNKRSVWTVTTKPFSEAHFATFPPDLIEPCVLAGCPESGLVYDPFMGSGTTAYVAKKLARHYLGSELNQEYIEIAKRRINSIETSLFLEEV